MRFQSFFMSATTHLLTPRRPAPCPGGRIVCRGRRGFALSVRVMDDQPKARTAGHGRPLQHLQVAVGVAEGRDRAAADKFIDADRLAAWPSIPDAWAPLPSRDEHERQLGVHRMFHPQGPIIVECRDAPGGRHEVGPALLGDARNEAGDRLFVGAVVPRWQRVGLRLCRLKTGSPGANKIGSAAVAVSRARRLMPRGARVGFMIGFRWSMRGDRKPARARPERVISRRSSDAAGLPSCPPTPGLPLFSLSRHRG